MRKFDFVLKVNAISATNVMTTNMLTCSPVYANARNAVLVRQQECQKEKGRLLL